MPLIFLLLFSFSAAVALSLTMLLHGATTTGAAIAALFPAKTLKIGLLLLPVACWLPPFLLPVFFAIPNLWLVYFIIVLVLSVAACDIAYTLQKDNKRHRPLLLVHLLDSSVIVLLILVYCLQID